MSFFNKKRTGSTYLKYQNGRIISLGKDEQLSSSNNIKGNKNFNEYNTEFDSENVQETVETNTPQNKKSKVLLIIGLCIILIPLTIIGFKAFNKYIGGVTDYMGSNNSEVQETNSNDDKAEETPIIDNPEKTTDSNGSKNETIQKTPEVINTNTNNSKVDESISLDSILSKFSPETVVLYSNKVNTSMTGYYSLVKSDLLLFYDSKESSYTTGKNLTAIKLIVNKDYKSVLSKEAIFEKENQKDLYITIKNRYVNLINTLDSITADVSRASCTPNFNKGLDVDNQLCAQQQEFMTTYLKDNDKNFEILDNAINIK